MAAQRMPPEQAGPAVEPTFDHVPVMLAAVVETLAPQDGELFVDCTLGGGGHARALLEAADCTVVGIDRDPQAIAAASATLAPYGDRFRGVRASFSELEVALDRLGISQVHGVLADLGVSSPQLDQPARGFSFRAAGPIDMRMDPDQLLTAQTIVDTWDEDRIAQLLWEFGEERKSRRVAKVIVEGRPWRDTAALASAVARAVGQAGRIHPATRTFQALRIAVNDELGELRRLLPQALSRLVAGGRLAVLTFHSLEDRIVKQFLDEAAGKNRPKDVFGNPVGAATVRLLPDLASADEHNPRARSARLRRAVRLP
jgi:16S rRNA (cytosine1402-N4)-methyltransferase